MPQTDPIVSQGHCARESPINDRNDWKTVFNAFFVINFTEADLEVKARGSVWMGTTLFSWGFAHCRTTEFSKSRQVSGLEDKQLMSQIWLPVEQSTETWDRAVGWGSQQRA